MAEIRIKTECSFKFKKSADFAKKIIKEYSKENPDHGYLDDISNLLSKNKYYADNLFIKDSHLYDINGPFQVGDKKFSFTIFGGSGTDDFFFKLSQILIHLKIETIFAIHYHDDGFEYFDALEDGQLKTIYTNGQGSHDGLFSEEDALLKFIRLYNDKKLKPPAGDMDKLVSLCQKGEELIPALFYIDDINQLDSNGESPLTAAVKSGKYENIMLICEQTNPDAMVKNAFGETAVSVAKEKGDKRVMDLLSHYSYDPGRLSKDAVEKAVKKSKTKVDDDPLIIQKIKHLNPDDELSVNPELMEESAQLIIPGEGLIDGFGNIILEPGYVNIEPFSQGIAYVRKDWENQGYFIDEKGTKCIDFPSSDKAIFNEGMAAVNYEDRSNRHSAIIDTQGKIIVKLDKEYYFRSSIVGSKKYTTPKISDNRVAIVKKILAGIIDSSGRIILEPRFDDISNFKEKRARYCHKNIDGIIDTDGNKVLEGRFNWLTHYREGIANGNIKGVSRFYDINGNVLFENDYYKAFLKYDFKGRLFKNGLLAVHQKSKGWGFINKKGQLVIDCEFDDVGDFFEDITFANYKGQWGLLTINAEFRPFNMKRPRLATPRFTLLNQSKGVIGVIDRKINEYSTTAYLNLDGQFIYRHGFKMKK